MRMEEQKDGTQMMNAKLAPGLAESHEAEVARWKAITAAKIAKSLAVEREARERRERLKDFDAPLV